MVRFEAFGGDSHDGVRYRRRRRLVVVVVMLILAARLPSMVFAETCTLWLLLPLTPPLGGKTQANPPCSCVWSACFVRVRKNRSPLRLLKNYSRACRMEALGQPGCPINPWLFWRGTATARMMNPGSSL